MLAYGQKLKPNSTIKAENTTFNTLGSKYGKMDVVNKNNIYYNKIPKVSGMNFSFEFAGKLSLLDAFTQVFSDDRIRQLLPETGIFITFYINPEGKILEVSFMVGENTLITAAELEKLENIIKAKISFKVHSYNANGADFFPVNYNVKYKKILDRTLLK